ncbi:MAG: RsmB/NOP family class I SAM-dependent RNA methyltransferase [Halobacteriovoraceae bacterium]|nr:RsmB/NOP family class I SAM-dependent RNA methyltransferase [Halobacteriovoraceae bacterium]
MGLDWSLFTERYEGMIPDFDSFIEKLGRPLPIGLRENQLHQLPYGLKEKLIQGSVKYNCPSEELQFFEVEGERKFWGGDIDHHLGLYFMQALSSLLPVLALNPKKNETVLDMCAAPGGKSCFLAEKMQNTGRLICCEPDLNRRRVLKANLSRIGVFNCFTFAGKGQELENELFDRILLDGPCSSEGTFREEVLLGKKRREVNFLTYNEAFRKKLHLEQRSLLDKAYELLKPEGTLVYSTCTYDPDENEGAVQYLLDKYPNCEVVPISFPVELEKKLKPGITNFKQPYDESLSHSRRIYPHYFNSIGFYVAKIIKR